MGGKLMYCKQCGSELRDGAAFCAKCGARQSVYEDRKHNEYVGFGQAIVLLFKNAFNFRTRASRSEYWWVMLFWLIISIPLSLVALMLTPLTAPLMLIIVIPGISLAVRRLHDVGKPGAWYCMVFVPGVGAIILLILFLGESVGDNEWGPGPDKSL